MHRPASISQLDGAAPVVRRTGLTALPAFALFLQATSASASGKEGDALVEPIRWIVMTVLVTFITLVVGGGISGAFKANQLGEPLLNGFARGLMKGLVAFLVVGAVAMAVITILGSLWIAYSFLHAGSIRPS